MWEERVRMGPPEPAAVDTAAGTPGEPPRASRGMRVPLAGWRAQQVSRWLAAAAFVGGGFVLAGIFFVASVMFSVWGSGPTTFDRVLQLGCIVGGMVAAALILWPLFGAEEPALILDERFLRVTHPDLVADMVIERSQISAVHASHSAGGAQAVMLGLRLNTFDGSNFEVAFSSPQRIPRARLTSHVSSQLGPISYASLGWEREVRGLRLRVQDVDWARQVFGTMPQYRELSEEDRTTAGLTPRRANQQIVGAVMVAALLAVKFLNRWVF